MGYFEDAKSLVEHAAGVLPTLKGHYDKSLHQKQIGAPLLIDIKNVMENLRSALDFSAHGIFDKYGSTTKSNPKIYFPYANANQDRAAFSSSNRIEICIPGITASRPDVVSKIESYQHFAGNAWLPKFMDLNNENKHEKLTPQTRSETKQLSLQSNGVSITLGEGCSISMGSGTSMQIGGMFVPGGQNISTNQPAQYFGNGTQTVITWVSFHFSSNNEPVIPFLTTAVHGVKRIVTELAAM